MVFNRIYNELNGQSSAEIILLLGGILIIVLVLFNFYKNYLSSISHQLNSSEITNFNNATERLSDRFRLLWVLVILKIWFNILKISVNYFKKFS